MTTDPHYNKNIDLPFTVKQSPDTRKVRAAENNSVRFDELVHDLKSPVNSLKGIIRLANMQVADEQAKEFFFMINECVDKLEHKISSTLNMFERGSDLTDVGQLDFREILYEIMVSLGHIDGFDKISFSTNIQNDKPFYSSKPLVESIIQNLLENSVKYRCEDNDLCIIKINIVDNDTGIQIQISDNGIGIDENQLPQIFDASFKSVMTQPDSHGLGLFIVKRAVEKLQGIIKVTSMLGSGTAFTVDLPNLD